MRQRYYRSLWALLGGLFGAGVTWLLAIFLQAGPLGPSMVTYTVVFALVYLTGILVDQSDTKSASYG